MITHFFIITGLSGAGKSQALKNLEDMGFFCVDNLPPVLAPKFVDICNASTSKLQKVALGIDIRAGKYLKVFNEVLEEIKKRKIKYKIIFFTANDATLLQRFSETRRLHPLGGRVIEGIRKERKMLERIFAVSDKKIDTSNMTIRDLKEKLSKEVSVATLKKMSIAVLSFGYKYGVPVDADLVIDVRFLPNPYYIPNLCQKSGKDTAVANFIKKQAVFSRFCKLFLDLIDFLIPNYKKEGKSYLTIAVGCTGGRHRSVFIAEYIAQYLAKQKLAVKNYHRDIDRNK